MLQILVNIQTELHGALAAYLSAFALDRDWISLASVLPMGIVFGAVHALTPGHSKAVMSAYLAGSPIGWLRSLGVSLSLSAMHVAMSVAIVLLSLPLVTFGFGRSAGEAPLLENVSRGILVAVGLWMIWRGVRRPRASHAHGALVGVTAGAIPCPLTLFAMIFAVQRGVPEAGLVFAAAMLIGVAATLSTVALATVLLRERAAGLLVRFGSAAAAGRILETAAGASLVYLGLAELLD